MLGKISRVTRNSITFTTEKEIDVYRVHKLANRMQPEGRFEVIDNRRITQSQRGKIFALINDLCDYTGDLPEEWERHFKWCVSRTFDIPDFSLSDCSVTTGNLMIEYILNFLFEENIPFRTKTWDSIPSDFPKQRLAIMHRKCVLCGKPADIAHYTAVGNRSRKLVDHRKLWFMSLCRKHHTEQHTVGIMTFCKRYHIKPIKLSESDLIHLGVMTRKRMNEIDNGLKNSERKNLDEYSNLNWTIDR